MIEIINAFFSFSILSTTDMFRSLIGKVHFSEQGTPDAAKERATYMMFLDLLYNIEGEYWYSFRSRL